MQNLSITANGQSQVFELGVGLTNLALMCSGAFSGVNCAFEATLDLPGATRTWFGIEAVRSVGNTIETTTGVLSAAPAYSWDIECGGYAAVRVRSTAWTSGAQAWAATGYLGGVSQAPALAPMTIAALSALIAGTALIGDVGLQARANATGAGSVFHLVAAGTTNAAVVKASPGRLLGVRITNLSAAMRKVAFHNSASAPTAGAAVYTTFLVPAGQTMVFASDVGIAFSAGIGLTTVVNAVDSDATAVTVGDLVIDLVFA